ncbi:MAG: hypothetical protein ACK4PR_12840 [Gammaproteobacteria bacterium]
MKSIWMTLGLSLGFIIFSNSYASNPACVNSPTLIPWGTGGSTNLTLCGYQNGGVNSSYVEFTNIPRNIKNACVTIQYDSVHDNHPVTDSLTVAPNEGVELAGSRGPTTLSIDNNVGAQTATLSLKTDDVAADKYGFSISGQSSSVNVDVIIHWDNDSGICGT